MYYFWTNEEIKPRKLSNVFKKDKFLSAQLFSEIKETLENSKQLLANVEAYCGLVEEVSLRRSFS
jgi:hypothetical protein